MMGQATHPVAQFNGLIPLPSNTLSQILQLAQLLAKRFVFPGKLFQLDNVFSDAGV